MVGSLWNTSDYLAHVYRQTPVSEDLCISRWFNVSVYVLFLGIFGIFISSSLAFEETLLLPIISSVEIDMFCF